jgi:hypothetical protein
MNKFALALALTAHAQKSKRLFGSSATPAIAQVNTKARRPAAPAR